MALPSLVWPALSREATRVQWNKFKQQAQDVLSANYHLGLTAFGGPPVHFQIVSKADVRIESFRTFLTVESAVPQAICRPARMDR